MEKEKKSDDDSASSLAWVWVIEYLASFKQVPISLIHDIIENAPALPEGGRGKKAKEMIALRSLEEMFGSGSGSSHHHSKVTFDSSESCEDVLERILLETPQSSLRMGMGMGMGMGGAELLKWDVTSFIAHKRASLRPTLQQLKDLILDGSYPHVDVDVDVDLLRDKSGLISVNKADNPVTLKKNHDDDDDCIVLNTSSSHPQSSKETTKQCPRGERSMPASFSLLPSKRSRIDSSEDEARQLPGSGCDDVSLTYNKLQLKQKQTLHSGEEGTSALFHKPDPSETQPEAVRDDINHFGEFQMGTSEGGQLVKEHSRSANRDELHKVIDIENVEERLPVEENDSGNDYHVKETVAIDVHEEDEGTLSDSDGYLNEKINIAMKKNELFSYQSTDDGPKLTLCMKCEKGGQLLSCNGSGCHLVVHEKCGSMNDSDYVYCLFCAYLSTISQYLEAKKEAALQRKNLTTFMRTCLEHQPMGNGGGPTSQR